MKKSLENTSRGRVVEGIVEGGFRLIFRLGLTGDLVLVKVLALVFFKGGGRGEEEEVLRLNLKGLTVIWLLLLLLLLMTRLVVAKQRI